MSYANHVVFTLPSKQVNPPASGYTASVLKRGVDVTVASLMLLVLSPLLLATYLAVRLTSQGGGFFHQERVGKDGQLFKMIKFRSMYTGAAYQARAAELAQMASDRDGICFKARNDPRVTLIGRFIRKYSIDELPQLINVLRGDMSLVGPRPALPAEVNEFPLRAHRRHTVVPGITGIWQTSGRADVSFDEMINMDLRYAETASFFMDAMLLLRTAKVVTTADGAY